jgi:hypothetical protein
MARTIAMPVPHHELVGVIHLLREMQQAGGRDGHGVVVGGHVDHLLGGRQRQAAVQAVPDRAPQQSGSDDNHHVLRIRVHSFYVYQLMISGSRIATERISITTIVVIILVVVTEGHDNIAGSH